MTEKIQSKCFGVAALMLTLATAGFLQGQETPASAPSAPATAPVATAATPAASDAAKPAPESQAWTWTTPFEWAQSTNNKLNEDYGVSLIFSYEATILGNVSGGVSRAAAYSSVVEFGANLDLEKIANIKGASFTATGLSTAGRNLSGAQWVNNAFTLSEVFVGNGTYLYQIYWEQKLMDGVIDIRAGRLNSSDFASLPAFVMQVNGGINGNPLSLFVDAPFFAQPYAMWGVDMKVTPSDEYFVYVGAYQAPTMPGNHHGTDLSFRGEDGFLFMGEIGWTPTFEDKNGSSLPGQYQFGSYVSTLAADRFDGNGQEWNSIGFYVIGQQMVWRNENNEDQNFSLWGGVTYSPDTQVAQMEVMGMAGFIWQGIIPNRNQDQLLGTFLVGGFSDPYGQSQVSNFGQKPTYEMLFELSYVININEYLFIQPDIQYVIRPNGVGNISDALVIGMQFGINL